MCGKWRVWLIAVSCGIVSCNSIEPSHTAPRESLTTLKIFARLLSEPLALEVSRQAGTAKVVVPLDSAGEKGELRQELHAALLVNLRAHRSELYLTRPSTDEAFYELRYALTSLGAKAERLRSFFGGGTVERTVTLGVRYTVVASLSGTEKVIAALDTVLTARDTVTVSDLARLEDVRFAETRPTLTESFFDNGILPVAIGAAIGAIVYLFFSVRSR